MVSLSNHVAIPLHVTPKNPVHPVHRCKNPSPPRILSLSQGRPLTLRRLIEIATLPSQ